MTLLFVCSLSHLFVLLLFVAGQISPLFLCIMFQWKNLKCRDKKSAIPNFIRHNWHLQPLSSFPQALCERVGIWIVACDI